MYEVVCNTSPLQYLHQIGQLRILPALAGSIIAIGISPSGTNTSGCAKTGGRIILRLDERLI